MTKITFKCMGVFSMITPIELPLFAARDFVSSTAVPIDPHWKRYIITLYILNQLENEKNIRKLSILWIFFQFSADTYYEVYTANLARKWRFIIPSFRALWYCRLVMEKSIFIFAKCWSFWEYSENILKQIMLPISSICCIGAFL